MRTASTLLFITHELLFTVMAATTFVVPSVTVLGNQTDPFAPITPD